MEYALSNGRGRDIRPRALPLPKLVRPGIPSVELRKGSVFDAALRPRRRTIIQGNLEQHHLDSNHDDRLYQQRNRIVIAEPEVHPIRRKSTSSSPRDRIPVGEHPSAYLRIEASSMIRGISSEKPADVRVRWMLRIWSAYDVTGEVTRLFEGESPAVSIPFVSIHKTRLLLLPLLFFISVFLFFLLSFLLEKHQSNRNIRDIQERSPIIHRHLDERHRRYTDAPASNPTVRNNKE